MERYNWQEIPQENLNERITRQMIHSPQATIARITLKQGAVVPLHQHVNEQVTMVLSGALQFEMDGVQFILHTGDVLVIPPDVPHRVEALEDSLATDLFTPRREDWIRGDDSYLRQATR
jgi:quercetin dioxygenase-like cupin family protein